MTNPAQNPSAVSVFQFESSFDVRVQLINNEPWFCLPDVCAVLDIQNSRDMVAKQLDGAGVDKIYISYASGKKQVTFVNEPNLYRVIFRSNKPEARVFQDWVFNDVLPSIRKTGQYIAPTVASQHHPDRTPCTNAQMREIKTLAHHIGNCFKFSESATQMAFNHLRVQFCIKNIADLPAVQHSNAMTMLHQLHSVSKQYQNWRVDSDKQAIALLLQQGQPWTPHIAKRLRQELNLQIEGNPNWQQLAQLLPC